MRRPYVIASIGLAVVLFLVISALLTRAFSVRDAEDAAIADLVKAEARGDYGRRHLAHLRLPHGFRLPGPGGDAHRLAASPGGGLDRRDQPLVVVLDHVNARHGAGRLVGGFVAARTQCVRVRHAGSVLTGFTVELLTVSPRIVTDAVCPTHF